MIRLLIVDDHPVVRAGLHALFDTERDFEVVGEASTAAEGVAMVQAGDPIDVVLMDLQFAGGGMQGAEATRSIRSLSLTGRAAASRVLVLTNYDTDADILGAVEAGASGYLLKDAPPAQLVAAVRAAARGESALAPAIAERLDERNTDVALSAREAEVLALVATGSSNREIAATLFLSEATVKSHLVHVFTKLAVSSRTAAVAAARERGILRAS